MKRLLAWLLALVLPVAVLAEEVGADASPIPESTAPRFPAAYIRGVQKGGNFVFYVEHGGAIIHSYLGTDEDVIIPDKLAGYPVVSILNNAFSNQGLSGKSKLRFVAFPDTVTYIGPEAFRGCSKLEQLVFPPDSQLREIDNSAFYDCPALTDVQLPDQVERIGHEAFGYCTSLTSFHIPASVTQMEGNPFPCCKSLTSITVAPENESFTVVNNMLIDKQPREIDRDDPNTAKTGSVRLLSYPCGLTETQVIIPEGVTEICSKAFFWCESLKDVFLPESLLAIETSAFYGCTSLAHANLPAGIAHITGNPFSDNLGLRQVSFSVTVTPGSYGEDWAIRHAIPFSY